MTELTFRRDFVPDYGRAVAVAPGVRRVTAQNPGPFTFAGTNSYIVGSGRVAIIDPGPADDAHIAALIQATAGEAVTHIVLTHSHRDHVAGAPALARLTGAPTYGAARRRSAAAQPVLDAGTDESFVPDVILADGTTLRGDDWALEVIATPGHASDHLAFAVGDGTHLISGDHVMGWSTTVVAPPDGAMAAYMASLDRLLARPETTYLPGHGGVLPEARAYTAALKAHRREREAAILARLDAGDRTIPAIVAAVYAGIDPRLASAAGLSVLAHIEDLVARGIVVAARDGYALTGRPAS